MLALPVGPKAPSQEPSETAQKPDAVVLMCEGCRIPRIHTFSHRQRISVKISDLIFECTKCSATRVYGRESRDA